MAQVARLCDRPESAGRENLTVDQVFRRLDFTAHPGIESWLRSCLNSALGEARGQKFLELRNKVLSHSDLEIERGEAARPDVELDSVRMAVESLAEFAWILESCQRGEQPDRTQPRPYAVEREQRTRREVEKLIGALAAGTRIVR